MTITAEARDEMLRLTDHEVPWTVVNSNEKAGPGSERSATCSAPCRTTTDETTSWARPTHTSSSPPRWPCAACRADRRRRVTLFHLSTVWLVVVLVAVVGGFTVIGIVVGRRVGARPDAEVEPVGVVQGTLLALVGLLLAFGLTMAVGRYEARRAVVVQEANDIGTTYLRPSCCPSRLAPRRSSC